MTNFIFISSLGPKDIAVFFNSLFWHNFRLTEVLQEKYKEFPYSLPPDFPNVFIPDHICSLFLPFQFPSRFTTKQAGRGNRFWSGFFLIFILIRTTMGIDWVPNMWQALSLALFMYFITPPSASPYRPHFGDVEAKAQGPIQFTQSPNSSVAELVCGRRNSGGKWGKSEEGLKDAENRVGAQFGRPGGQTAKATCSQSETSAIVSRWEWLQTQTPRCDKKFLLYEKKPEVFILNCSEFIYQLCGSACMCE